MLGEDGLIERVAAGDRVAFGALVARWRDPIWRFVRAHTPTPALAEEALQETFVGVWRGASGLRDPAAFRGWMYGLARRQAARASRRRVGEPLDAEPIEQLGVAAGWGSEARGGAVLARIEDHDAVRHALAALSDDDREVVWLVDVDELSLAEAADALGLSLAATKSRLHRARLRLMAALAEGGTDG